MAMGFMKPRILSVYLFVVQASAMAADLTVVVDGDTLRVRAGKGGAIVYKGAHFADSSPMCKDAPRSRENPPEGRQDATSQSRAHPWKWGILESRGLSEPNSARGKALNGSGSHLPFSPNGCYFVTLKAPLSDETEEKIRRAAEDSGCRIERFFRRIASGFSLCKDSCSPVPEFLEEARSISELERIEPDLPYHLAHTQRDLPDNFYVARNLARKHTGMPFVDALINGHAMNGYILRKSLIGRPIRRFLWDYVFTRAGSGVDIYVIDGPMEEVHDELEGRLEIRRPDEAEGAGAGGAAQDRGRAFLGKAAALSTGIAGEEPKAWNPFSMKSLAYPFVKSLRAEISKHEASTHSLSTCTAIAGKYIGLAKEARIVLVPAFRSMSASLSEIALALETVLDARSHRPAVVLLPFSGPKSEAMEGFVQQMHAQGIYVVAAAGNLSDSSCRYSPGGSPYAITVGSINASGNVSKFSNRGECTDVFAVGEGVTVGRVKEGRHVYDEKEGTSLAAAYVAGLLATVVEDSPRTLGELRKLLASGTRLGQKRIARFPENEERKSGATLFKRFTYVRNLWIRDLTFFIFKLSLVLLCLFWATVLLLPPAAVPGGRIPRMAYTNK